MSHMFLNNFLTKSNAPKKLFSSFVFVLVGVAGMHFFVSDVYAQGVVSLSPQDTTLTSIGNTVQVDVNVLGTIDSSAYQVVVEFDPSVLQVNSVTNGDFLNGTLVEYINEDNVDFSIFTFSGSSGDGNGTVGTIVFEAVGNGTSSLAITKAAFTPASGGNPVNATVTNGSIVVGSSVTATPTNPPRVTATPPVATSTPIPTDIPPSGFTSFFSPSSQNINLSDSTVTVDINVADAPSSSAFQVVVDYDPSIIQLVNNGVVNGDFLNGTPISYIDNSLGNVDFSIVTFSGSGSGNGTLGTLTFNIVGSGTSPLTITKAAFTPVSGGNPVYSDVNSGSITVESSGATNTPNPDCPRSSQGDANCDGDVDLVDYATWFLNYDKSLTGPSFGDFNSSGKVDLIDYTIWFNNYDLSGTLPSPTSGSGATTTPRVTATPNPSITTRPTVTLFPDPSVTISVSPTIGAGCAGSCVPLGSCGDPIGGDCGLTRECCGSPL